jgi:transketolase
MDVNKNTGIAELGINTVRVLAADAVQKANSGHPGTPMATAPMGHVLWTEFMHYNPRNPQWPNRDRFVLSAGHACLLQYIYLHLTGYDISLDDLKNFRQLNSKTPGHPEYGLTSGIEVTTGPLGQGFANGVGMAIGQEYLAARYNKPGLPVFDYTIYCLCSDGDMMEGVSSEAASIAGHLKLGSLVYLYDDNHISIEGNTAITFNEDIGKRFEAYGWHVQTVPDGNDIDAIAAALRNAKNEQLRPSLIKVRTHIAYGSPNKVDTAGAHGAPLGEEEVKLVKANLGFDPGQSFVIPEAVAAFYREAGAKGMQKEKEWSALYKTWQEKYPDEANEYELWSSGKLPEGWKQQLPVFSPAGGKVATRKASGKTLNAIAGHLPLLIGGSADLSPSTDTHLEKYDDFEPGHRSGRNFHFGVREHAMGAILNGMALTHGIIPYGATFLIFSDYMRPPIRLAAIMKIRPVFIYTHDSIGLGEDGTTHQPVEQLAALRAIPNITVIRPADANETVQAWRVALQHSGGPVVLVLTRQSLPVIDRSVYADAIHLERGGYILADTLVAPQILLIGTGSEVHLLLEAKERLEQDSINARVISMPSWELFEKQDAAYKNRVLPKEIRKRIVVEAASPQGWEKYATDEGVIIGMTGFGESAPAEALMPVFGFTVDNILARARALLQASLV